APSTVRPFSAVALLFLLWSTHDAPEQNLQPLQAAVEPDQASAKAHHLARVRPKWPRAAAHFPDENPCRVLDIWSRKLKKRPNCNPHPAPLCAGLRNKMNGRSFENCENLGTF